MHSKVPSVPRESSASRKQQQHQQPYSVPPLNLDDYECGGEAEGDEDGVDRRKGTTNILHLPSESRLFQANEQMRDSSQFLPANTSQHSQIHFNMTASPGLVTAVAAVAAAAPAAQTGDATFFQTTNNKNTSMQWEHKNQNNQQAHKPRSSLPTPGTFDRLDLEGLASHRPMQPKTNEYPEHNQKLINIPFNQSDSAEAVGASSSKGEGVEGKGSGMVKTTQTRIVSLLSICGQRFRSHFFLRFEKEPIEKLFVSVRLAESKTAFISSFVSLACVMFFAFIFDVQEQQTSWDPLGQNTIVVYILAFLFDCGVILFITKKPFYLDEGKHVEVIRVFLVATQIVQLVCLEYELLEIVIHKFLATFSTQSTSVPSFEITSHCELLKSFIVSSTCFNLIHHAGTLVFQSLLMCFVLALQTSMLSDSSTSFPTLFLVSLVILSSIFLYATAADEKAKRIRFKESIDWQQSQNSNSSINNEEFAPAGAGAAGQSTGSPHNQFGAEYSKRSNNHHHHHHHHHNPSVNKHSFQVHIPSLQQMVFEEISTGLIVISQQASSSAMSPQKISLEFANKTSIAQLRCSQESDILLKLKQVSVPELQNLNDSLNNSHQKQPFQMYDNSTVPAFHLKSSTSKDNNYQQITLATPITAPATAQFPPPPHSANLSPTRRNSTPNLYELLAEFLEEIINHPSQFTKKDLLLHQQQQQQQQQHHQLKQQQQNHQQQPRKSIGQPSMPSSFLKQQNSLNNSLNRGASRVRTNSAFARSATRKSIESNSQIVTPKKEKSRENLQSPSHQQYKKASMDPIRLAIPDFAQRHRASIGGVVGNSSPTNNKNDYLSQAYIPGYSMHQLNNQQQQRKQISQKRFSLNEGQVVMGVLNKERSSKISMAQLKEFQPVDNDGKDTFQLEFKVSSIVWQNSPAIMIQITDSTQKMINTKMQELDSYKEELLYTMQHISRTPLNSIINLSEILLNHYFRQYHSNPSRSKQKSTSSSSAAAQANSSSSSPARKINNKQTTVGMQQQSKKFEMEMEELEDIVQNLHIIKNNGYILLHTINTVTDLSVFQTNHGKLDINTDSFYLSDVFREIKDLYLHQIQEKNLTFEFTAASVQAETMHSDRKRIIQVLIEIIGNAIKYTNHGGIHVKVKEQEQGLIWVKVEDTGVGMSSELKFSLFRKNLIQYFSRERDFHRKNSAGIGLDFSRKIVGLLGPFFQVFLKSEEGKGSAFKFLLYANYEHRSSIDIEQLRRRIMMLQHEAGGIITPDPRYRQTVFNKPDQLQISSSGIQKNYNTLHSSNILLLKKDAQPTGGDQFSMNVAGTAANGNALLYDREQFTSDNNLSRDNPMLGHSTIQLQKYISVEYNNNERYNFPPQSAQLPYHGGSTSIKNPITPATAKQPHRKSQLEVNLTSSTYLSGNPRRQLGLSTSQINVQQQQQQQQQINVKGNSGNLNGNAALGLSQQRISAATGNEIREEEKSKEIKKSKNKNKNTTHVVGLEEEQVNDSFQRSSDEEQNYFSANEVQVAQERSSGFPLAAAAAAIATVANTSVNRPAPKLQQQISSANQSEQEGRKRRNSKNSSNGMGVTFGKISNESFGPIAAQIRSVYVHQTPLKTSPNTHSRSTASNQIISKNNLLDDSTIQNSDFEDTISVHMNNIAFPKLQKQHTSLLQQQQQQQQQQSLNFNTTNTNISQVTTQVTTGQILVQAATNMNGIGGAGGGGIRGEGRTPERRTTQLVQSIKIDDGDAKLHRSFPHECFVLGIDDNVFNLNILELIFKKCPTVHFHKASNGEECLERATHLKNTQNASYKLFLMDIQMPVMDGYKAHSELKKMMARNEIDPAPVFAVTAYANEKIVCQEEGMEGFIEKPINLKLLYNTIYDYFYHHPTVIQQTHNQIHDNISNYPQ